MRRERRFGRKSFFEMEIQEYYWKDRHDKQKYDIQAIVLVGKKKSGGTIKILCKYSEVKKFLLERYQYYQTRALKYRCFEEIRAFWQSPDDPLLQTSYAEALKKRQFNSEITRTENIDLKLLRTLKQESNVYPKKPRNVNVQLKPCFIKNSDGIRRTSLYYSLDLWDKGHNYLRQVIDDVLNITYIFKCQAYKYESVFMSPSHPIRPKDLPKDYEMSKSKIQLIYWQNVDSATGKRWWEAKRFDLFSFDGKQLIVSYKFKSLSDVARVSPEIVSKDFIEFITKFNAKPPKEAVLVRFSNPERLTIR